MSIAFISPTDVRQQTLETKSKSLPGVGFPEIASAVGGTGAAAVAVAGNSTQSYQSAAVINAAVSGISGAGGLSTTGGTPWSSGGIGYGGVPSAGGYVGASVPGGSVGAGAGVGGGLGTGPYGGNYDPATAERAALMQQMNDANWQMLVAQVTVGEISRDYQARSNILKTKADTELNAVRNMRA